jgi:hypothetical protein
LVAHRTTAEVARLNKVRTVENLKEIIFCRKIKKALLTLINSAELKKT